MPMRSIRSAYGETSMQQPQEIFGTLHAAAFRARQVVAGVPPIYIDDTKLYHWVLGGTNWATIGPPTRTPICHAQVFAWPPIFVDLASCGLSHMVSNRPLHVDILCSGNGLPTHEEKLGWRQQAVQHCRMGI